MSGQLEERTEPSGQRHYLDGKPIHAGDFIEMRLTPEMWLVVRYEWNFRSGSRPLLCFDAGCIEPVRQAVFRWPGET